MIERIIAEGMSSIGFSVSNGMREDVEASARIYKQSRDSERVKRLRRSTHHFVLSLRNGSVELLRALAHVYSRV